MRVVDPSIWDILSIGGSITSCFDEVHKEVFVEDSYVRLLGILWERHLTDSDLDSTLL